MKGSHKGSEVEMGGGERESGGKLVEKKGGGPIQNEQRIMGEKRPRQS